MVTSLVSDAVVTTAGAVFVVSGRNGDIHPRTLEGFYSHDTRFLSCFRVRLSGREPAPLGSDTFEHAVSSFYARSAGTRSFPEGAISLVRDRMVGQGLHEDIGLFNHSSVPRQVRLELQFDADFADVFEIRRGPVRKRGETSVEPLPGQGLRFVYRWREFQRATHVTFADPPEIQGKTAVFEFTLEPRDTWYTCVNVLPEVDGPLEPRKCEGWALGTAFGAYRRKGVGKLLLKHRRPAAGPLEDVPRLETDHVGLIQAYAQSIPDLRALEMTHQDGHYSLAAGLPWFMALFGRDSIISALQTKILGPNLMTGTLKTLARLQARDRDDASDAEPGKIPHEVREGEQTIFELVRPQQYYGSVDSTPLFLVLFAEAYRWTGDLTLVEALLPAAEAALAWIDEHGDSDGDGFVEYQRRTPNGLFNQSWKDSHDSISFAGGELAKPPIAAAEVQGYVYAAKSQMADVYRALGREDRAARLAEEAAALKKRFDEAFWMPEAGYYAIALDSRMRQVDSIASNAGHLLWSGIVELDRAEQVRQRLLAPDMFSGWGIRTLSTEMARYDPVSYHNGSVWPHDNSIIVAGLARYGFTAEADEVICSMLDATSALPDHRLPELFAGYPRRELSFPVGYPSANAPQAWASGAIIHFVETLLRVRSDGDQLVTDGPPPAFSVSLESVPYRGTKWDVSTSAERVRSRDRR